MKEFFKSPKAIFIGVAILLNLGSLGLVFTGKIEFSTFLQSIGIISTGVFALYQFYIKEAVIKEANVIITTAKQLQQQNEQLRSINDNLNIKVSNMEMSEAKNAEAIESPVKTKTK